MMVMYKGFCFQLKDEHVECVGHDVQVLDTSHLQYFITVINNIQAQIKAGKCTKFVSPSDTQIKVIKVIGVH